MLASVWLLGEAALPRRVRGFAPRLSAVPAGKMLAAGAEGWVKSSVRAPLVTVVGPL